MEILRSLGINETLWIHMACFLISYFAITELILKPYMAALREREKRTIGNEETATRLIDEANELYAIYEKQARASNNEVKGIYDHSRGEAMKEYDRIISAAREDATRLLDSARAQIATEVQTARKTLSNDVPAVSSVIATKLAGKDISL